jgi:prevent-host-death family protein
MSRRPSLGSHPPVAEGRASRSKRVPRRGGTVADMESVGIRELADRASSVVSEVETTGHAVLVTRRGRPIAVLSAIDEDAFYDYVLAHAPEYVQGMRDADERYGRGESDSRPLHEVLAELDAEDAGQAASA